MEAVVKEKFKGSAVRVFDFCSQEILIKPCLDDSGHVVVKVELMLLTFGYLGLIVKKKEFAGDFDLTVKYIESMPVKEIERYCNELAGMYQQVKKEFGE